MKSNFEKLFKKSIKNDRFLNHLILDLFSLRHARKQIYQKSKNSVQWLFKISETN